MKLAKKLSIDFVKFISSQKIENYLDYYNYICLWIKKNSFRIDNKLIKMEGLDSLIEIDASKYIPDNLNFNFTKEVLKWEEDLPSKVGELLMVLRDTLWEMVTWEFPYKGCPICDQEIRIVKVRNNLTKEEKFIYRCEECPWEENITGEWQTDENCDYLPVTTEEVKRLNL